jgi:hypothetical protein
MRAFINLETGLQMQIVGGLCHLSKQVVRFVMKNPGALLQVVANRLRMNQKSVPLIKAFGKTTMIATV